MNPIKTSTLLSELQRMVTNHIHRTEVLMKQDIATLTHRPSEKSWNALECFAHLNLYGEFYLMEIEKSIKQANPIVEEYFRAGLLGGMSAVYMLPQNGKVKKMRTFSSKDTYKTQVSSGMLTTFIHQQNHMLELLSAASKVSLTRTKTKITLPVIKFRLGDTLRFVIFHNERHLQQAERAASAR